MMVFQLPAGTYKAEGKFMVGAKLMVDLGDKQGIHA